jgi:hypothetical protein
VGDGGLEKGRNWGVAFKELAFGGRGIFFCVEFRLLCVCFRKDEVVGGLSVLVFKEDLSRLQSLGLFLILSGVVLLARDLK